MSSVANAGAVRDPSEGPRQVRASRGQVVTSVGQTVAAAAAAAAAVAAVAAAVVAASGAAAAFTDSPEQPCRHSARVDVLVVREKLVSDLDRLLDHVVERP